MSIEIKIKWVDAQDRRWSSAGGLGIKAKKWDDILTLRRMMKTPVSEKEVQLMLGCDQCSLFNEKADFQKQECRPKLVGGTKRTGQHPDMIYVKCQGFGREVVGDAFCKGKFMDEQTVQLFSW